MDLLKVIHCSNTAELKSILHLNSAYLHHKSGEARVTRDVDMVNKDMAAMGSNQFASKSTTLIHIATGQHAEPKVIENLINTREIGMKVLSDSIDSDNGITAKVKLQTFHTQNAKPTKTKGQTAPLGKSDEVVTLLRMTQIIASG